MTTPTGQISLNDVNVELGLSGTTTISMNQTNVRTLAGVPSGAISMQNLQGKSNRVSISYTFSASTANASLNLSTISGYSSGKSDITVTINGGVYLYATSTGNYGLNLSGGTTGDTLTIVNNGFILGQGGNGGAVDSGGSPGGPALNLGFGFSSCTINNTNGSAYIAGGGGGGGAGSSASASFGTAGSAGGGAGGGNGGSGASGGSIGSSGSNGSTYQGGGGGRILPGSGGAGDTGSGGGGGGAGGGGGYGTYVNNTGKQSASYSGGSGGSANGGGSNAQSSTVAAGGGGGWGASGGSSNYGGAGGGKAVNTNGIAITWVSGNTTRVYGSVS